MIAGTANKSDTAAWSDKARQADTATRADTARRADSAGWADSASVSTRAKIADEAGRAGSLGGSNLYAILRRLGGHDTPNMTPLMDWDRMKQLNNGNDVRNIRNGGTGIVAYGGDNGFNNGYPQSTILLKQSYKNFDKILCLLCNDGADVCFKTLFDRWELELLFSNSYGFFLGSSESDFWTIFGGNSAAIRSQIASTETVWRGKKQNAGIIEIYGINY